MTTRTIRVVLYMDASPWAANSNTWFATAQPGPAPQPIAGYRRYQLVAEIPDPRAADEVVRAEVTEVTEETQP